MQGIQSKRFRYYTVALIVRLALSFFFIDQDDGPVFFATAHDVLIGHKHIYYEGSAQNLFNYLPLAYLTILPGLAIYYLLGLHSLYWKVFFLKLPFILGDMYLPYLISKPLDNVTKLESENLARTRGELSRTEIFLLFNPFIIYTSAIKGQFDIFPVIFLVIGWRQFLEGKNWKSGMSIATSILMKQYGILFSVFLGLHLLKKKYKEFPKFFFGHLIIAIPIVGIVAYFNLDGLIDHALLYHLSRPPSGYSFTSIILYSLRILIRQRYSSTLSLLVGNIIIEIFQALLIFSLIYLGVQMWQSQNEMSDLIKYLMFAHLCFYFFNNVLWIQYFIIFLVLWSEYLRVTDREIKMVSIYWGYVCIPMAVVIRAKLYTISNVTKLLGGHWFTIIWIIGVVTHYIMFFYYHKRKTNMYEFWYARLLHTLMTILLPFQYYLMENFAKTKSELFP